MAAQFDGAAFGQEIVKAVREYMDREVKPLKARVAELESRTLRYVGVHIDGKVYNPGEMVTYSGSLWHCEGTTVSKPGADGSWRLAVKRNELNR